MVQHVEMPFAQYDGAMLDVHFLCSSWAFCPLHDWTVSSYLCCQAGRLSVFGCTACMDGEADRCEPNSHWALLEDWKRVRGWLHSTWLKNVADNLISVDVRLHEAIDTAQKPIFLEAIGPPSSALGTQQWCMLILTDYSLNSQVHGRVLMKPYHSYSLPIPGTHNADDIFKVTIPKVKDTDNVFRKCTFPAVACRLMVHCWRLSS